MNRREWIASALELIEQRSALAASTEYELEELGLITTNDGPYATLTASGRVFLAEHRFDK